MIKKILQNQISELKMIIISKKIILAHFKNKKTKLELQKHKGQN